MKAFRLVNCDHDPVSVGAYLERASTYSNQKLCAGMYFATSRKDALEFAKKDHGHIYTHLLTCGLTDMDENDFVDLVADPNLIVRQNRTGQTRREATETFCRENNKKGVIWQSPPSASSRGWKELCLLPQHIQHSVLIREVEELSAHDVIKAIQQAWATRNGLAFDKDGYCLRVQDNLFRGLSQAARKDFEGGDGAELGKDGGRGKLQALHSSSALACNWFDYWRTRDLGPLAQAFGVPGGFSTLALEQKIPNGLGRISPNLDVFLTGDDRTVFAIESKFTEPYMKSKAKTYLKSAYFPDGHSLWSEAGLPVCQAVAETLRTERHDFNLLDVAQLLKHMLALARRFGFRWSLSCLWFKLPGSIADRHRKELADFTAQIGADAAHFSTLTYQELFARMVPFVGQDDSEYIAYLRDRYVGDKGGS